MARRALVGILAALALAAPPAEAQTDLRFVEQLTVGHFRSWNETGQAAYVLGVYSFATYNGLTCPTALTVGEYQAALVHNRVQISDSDPLAKVMVALFLRNGCSVK